MSVIPMQKIQLFGFRNTQEKTLKLLQKRGDIQVSQILLKKDPASRGWQNNSQENQEANLTVANLEFAIKLLKPYEQKRSPFLGPRLMTPEKVETTIKEFDYQKLIQKCREIEEKMVTNRNVLFTLPAETDLKPWLNLNLPIDASRETENYLITIGSIPLDQLQPLQKELQEKSKLTEFHLVHQDQNTVYFSLIYEKSLDPVIKELLLKYRFAETEFGKVSGTPKEILESIRQQKQDLEKENHELENQLKALGKDSEKLKVTYDYFVWQKSLKENQLKLAHSEYGFVIEGWILKPKLTELKNLLEQEIKNVALIEIKPEKDEKPPVQIENPAFMRPFEFVTKIYGLPAWNSVDPTAYLSPFFILFFGLCLSDAGYGIILFVLSIVALKAFKIPKDTGTYHLLKLLLWGGMVTFAAGIITGGWFGLTPEQAPGFLVEDITNSTGTIVKTFKYQLINPTGGNGPMTFLIVSLLLGVVHLAFGLIIDFVFKIKNGQLKEAFLDTLLWFYFLAALIVYGLTVANVLPVEWTPITSKLAILGAIFLVLTQGRHQKNIVGKIGIGILSLYNVVGYMSDILSYSRIMALGLGTGVIAFAMNTIATIFSGMIPYVGFIFFILIILIGHVMNILISTLGSFVHSARLQFVEFFSKFMEGGGRDFTPLKRQCKYIFLRET